MKIYIFQTSPVSQLCSHDTRKQSHFYSLVHLNGGLVVFAELVLVLLEFFQRHALVGFHCGDNNDWPFTSHLLVENKSNNKTLIG